MSILSVMLVLLFCITISKPVVAATTETDSTDKDSTITIQTDLSNPNYQEKVKNYLKKILIF